ncbi:hypothetical protein [Streptomyces sp. NPDC002328]|uniref:hypothetical protein n=1 Tax=Streptomyces sp. NPDC002328 TaxID=3364642 RepID=UPI0036A8A70B
MKRSSGARLCAVTAAGALSLALITGCSDDGSKKDGKGAKDSVSSSSSSSSAPAAKALSKAELEKLLLAQGDVKGYKVASGDDTLPKSKSVVKSDKAECYPIIWASGALAPGETDVNVSNSVSEDKASTATASPEDLAAAFDINITFVGLSSYEGDGAEKTMKAVSDAVAACGGGYTVDVKGEKTKVTKVSAAKGSGLGDESVGFTESVDMDGEGTATVNGEVVRKGNTVATFYTVNFVALSGGKVVPVPPAVIQAQVAKLK